MPTNGFRLFRIFGITVYLHWMWVLGLIYEVQSLRNAYPSRWIGWNILEYLALFLIVLLHEFGHALACKSVGGKADRIILWPLGGVAYVQPPLRPGAMLWSIVAGPLVNVVLIPVTVGLYVFARSLSLNVSPDLIVFYYRIAYINIGLLVFNILPIYPLDGGKILWSLLWFILGMGRSLMIASVVGLIGAAGLGVLALYVREPLLAFIALWAVFLAFNGFKSAQKIRRVEQIARRPNFVCPNCGVAPPIGPHWVCPRCHIRYDAFDSLDQCPNCHNPHAWNPCLNCGARIPNDIWRGVHATIVTPPPMPQNPA
jgi:Zn-dependent protease